MDWSQKMADLRNSSKIWLFNQTFQGEPKRIIIRRRFCSWAKNWPVWLQQRGQFQLCFWFKSQKFGATRRCQLMFIVCFVAMSLVLCSSKSQPQSKRKAEDFKDWLRTRNFLTWMVYWVPTCIGYTGFTWFVGWIYWNDCKMVQDGLGRKNLTSKILNLPFNKEVIEITSCKDMGTVWYCNQNGSLRRIVDEYDQNGKKKLKLMELQSMTDKNEMCESESNLMIMKMRISPNWQWTLSKLSSNWHLRSICFCQVTLCECWTQNAFNQNWFCYALFVNWGISILYDTVSYCIVIIFMINQLPLGFMFP